MSKIKELIEDSKIDGINELFNKTTSTSEFEIMFSNRAGEFLNFEKYKNLLEFLKIRSKNRKLKLTSINSLDIIYSPKKDINYRITIDGLEDINKYMKMLNQQKNTVIYTSLIKKYKESGSKIRLIKKTKKKIDVVDVDELLLRFRLSSEEDVTKKELQDLENLKGYNTNPIIFRYKQRMSLFVEEDKNHTIRIDLTIIQMNRNLKNLHTSMNNYELEIDVENKDRKKEYLETCFREIQILLKLLEQNNYILSRTQKENVLDIYKYILNITSTTQITLDGRKPVSLEIQHVSENLPNKYAVTDKADGERCFLIIIDKRVYLITNNLNVRDTGLTIKDDKYNKSILDGENIFLKKNNKYLFMVFDCLFYGGEDIRNTPSLFERLKKADEVIKNCFIGNNEKGYEMGEYTDIYNIKKLQEFYDNEIKKYMSNLNADIKNTKNNTVVRRKLFIGANGSYDSEIFAYSELIWNKYTKDHEINCPYHLDGLIFQPLMQEYVTNASKSKLSDYKWKPPNQNSIDFYIQFEKSVETGKILTLYDNSQDEYIRNKPYKICRLFVGQNIIDKDTNRGSEQPVLFKSDEEKHIAYLFLKDNQIRDEEGNIIQDNTVVEFYYKNDLRIEEKFRWVPMRTRYDKTDRVNRYKKQYGNYVTIAEKVWRSIINPVQMSDFQNLLDEKKYDYEIAKIRTKIKKEVIISTNRENAYYYQSSKLVQGLRQFHNFIKSNLIYTYFNKMYRNGERVTILDYSGGRGGDIQKLYHAEVKSVVVLDLDKESLLSVNDGYQSRYLQNKEKYPDYPKFTFIHANGGVLLNTEDQEKSLGIMTKENKDNIEKYLSGRTKYDCINCQFAMHFFLENEETWNNFKENINKNLKEGGYYIATCYDARLVVNLLKGTDKITTHYTQDGNKEVLFEIVKKYKDPDENTIIGVGNMIDVHSGWINRPDEYYSEYLVDKKFIEKELLETCNMELVETDTFKNQFDIHKDYLKNIAGHETYTKTKGTTKHYMENVYKFYNEDDERNANIYVNSFLNRYYVFRKRKSVTTKQKGGGELNKEDSEENKFNNLTQLELEYKKEYTFMDSIYKSLQYDKLIPNNMSMSQFYSDLGIRIKKDKNINKNTYKILKNKLHIYNEYETDSRHRIKKHVINGLDVIIAQNNSSGTYDYPKIPKNMNKYIILNKTEDGDKYSVLLQSGKCIN
jgi:hypothetical protein